MDHHIFSLLLLHLSPARPPRAHFRPNFFHFLFTTTTAGGHRFAKSGKKKAANLFQDLLLCVPL